MTCMLIGHLLSDSNTTKRRIEGRASDIQKSASSILQHKDIVERSHHSNVSRPLEKRGERLTGGSNLFTDCKESS